MINYWGGIKRIGIRSYESSHHLWRCLAEKRVWSFARKAKRRETPKQLRAILGALINATVAMNVQGNVCCIVVGWMFVGWMFVGCWLLVGCFVGCFLQKTGLPSVLMTSGCRVKRASWAGQTWSRSFGMSTYSNKLEWLSSLFQWECSDSWEYIECFLPFYVGLLPLAYSTINLITFQCTTTFTTHINMYHW